MENLLKKTCEKLYFNIFSVCLLLHKKSLYNFFCIFNMSSLSLLLPWKLWWTKLVKGDNLICLMYVSFYTQEICIIFFVYLIYLVSISFCDENPLKKTCKKRCFNMIKVRLLLYRESLSIFFVFLICSFYIRNPY